MSSRTRRRRDPGLMYPGKSGPLRSGYMGPGSRHSASQPRVNALKASARMTTECYFCAYALSRASVEIGLLFPQILVEERRKLAEMLLRLGRVRVPRVLRVRLPLEHVQVRDDPRLAQLAMHAHGI